MFSSLLCVMLCGHFALDSWYQTIADVNGVNGMMRKERGSDVMGDALQLRNSKVRAVSHLWSLESRRHEAWHFRRKRIQITFTFPNSENRKLFMHPCRFYNFLWVDSAVGIATDYGLDDGGVEFESRWGQEFSFFYVVQNCSEAHPASYPMVPVGFLPGGGIKRRGREADHPPSVSAEVNKMWIYMSTPPDSFMA
jgi:hypothetical protein